MLRSERILQLAVAATLAGGLASAAWASSTGGSELIYDFNNANTTTGVVPNTGTWGTFDGQVTPWSGTEGGRIVADSAVIAGSGTNAGSYAPMLNVLWAKTTNGTMAGAPDANTGNVAHTGFHTPDAVGTNTTTQNQVVSFWMKATSANEDIIGVGGGQSGFNMPTGSGMTHAYNTASGDKYQQQNYTGTPFSGYADWHYYSVTLTDVWSANAGLVYKDGVQVAVQGCCNSRDTSFQDTLGLRVAGHKMGLDLLIQNLRFDTYSGSGTIAPAAIATNNYNAQFFKQGDTDRDRLVSNSDIGVVFGNYDDAATTKTWAQGDFDQNGNVDNSDIGYVFGNYNDFSAGQVGNSSSTIANLIYDASTGDVKLDAGEAAGGVITNFVLKNAVGGQDFNLGANLPFSGLFRKSTATEISNSDGNAVGFSGVWDLGLVFPTGLSLTDLQTFLTQATYTGSLGSSNLQLDLTLAAPVPEPASLSLLALGGLGLLARRRRA